MSTNPKVDIVGTAAAFKQNLIPQLTSVKTESLKQNSGSWATPETGQQFEAAFLSAQERYDIPPGMLSRMALQESSYNPNAKNASGATGLMQIIPKWHPGVDANDPNQSIERAASYMRENYNRFGSWEKALAAYNWGPTALAKGGLEKAPEETQNYVSQIMADVEGASTNANIESIKAVANSAPLTKKESQKSQELKKQNELALSAALKKSQSQKNKTSEEVKTDPKDPSNYSTMNEWVEANGTAPYKVANYYMLKEFDDRAANFEQVRKETKIREENAWASDSELFTKTGIFKQLLSEVAVGGVRSAGHLASMPYTIRGKAERANVDDRAISLYDRSLSSDDPLSVEENTYLDGIAKPNSADQRTRRQLLKSAYKNEDTANFISDLVGPNGLVGKPIDQLVNPLNKQILDDDLGKSYETNLAAFSAAEDEYKKGNMGAAVLNAATGVIGLTMDGAGDLWDNPAATFEYVAENAPQLALGKVSKSALLATNFAYGADIYSDALADYKNTYGKSPTQKEALHMAAWALSASMLEQVADASILKQFSSIPNGTDFTKAVLTKLANTAIAKTTAGRVSTKVAEVAANNLVTRTAAATTSGAVKEGVTEAYQTTVEENLSKLKYTNFDGFNIFKGGLIGFGVGGVYSGTGRGVNEIFGLTADRQNTSLKPTRKLTANEERINELATQAAVTGDVTPLLNADSPATYSLEQAANALAHYINKPETTPEERLASKDKIAEIIAVQESTVAELQAEVDKLMLVDIESMSKKEVKAYGKKFKPLLAALDKARSTADNIAGFRDLPIILSTPSEEVINEDITKAESTEASPERDQAVNRVITLTMQSPTSVSDAQLDRLKNLPSLNSEQRDYLANFTEAHSAINALNDPKNTSRDIINGRYGFKGILQHEADISAAIRSGDKALAVKELNALKDFLLNHEGKRLALLKGQAAFNENNKRNIHLVKDPNEASGWRIATETPNNWNRSLNGGWDFMRNKVGQLATESLIKRIGNENAALQAAVQQHESALAIAFDTPIVSAETTNNNKSTPPANAGATPDLSVEESPAPINNEQVAEIAAEIKHAQQQIADINRSIAKAWGPATDRQTNAVVQWGKAITRAKGKLKDIGLSEDEIMAIVNRKPEPKSKTNNQGKPVRTDREVLESNIANFKAQLEEEGISDFKREALQSNIDSAEKRLALISKNEIPTSTKESTPEIVEPTETEESTEEEVNTEEETTEDGVSTSEEILETASPKSGVLELTKDESQRVDGNMLYEKLINPLTNWISAYWKQSRAPKNAVTSNPLVEIKDFYSYLTASGEPDFSLLNQFIENAITEEQQNQLSLFMAKVSEWSDAINDNINLTDSAISKKTENAGGKSYVYQDYALNFKGAVPENVNTAIALAAFLWISEKAGGNGLNSYSTIKQMLDYSDDQILTELEIERYSGIGTNRAFVVQDLGSKIRTALNMTTISNAPSNEQTNFELAMGAQALAILQQFGLTEQFDETTPQSEVIAVGKPVLLNTANKNYNKSGANKEGRPLAYKKVMWTVRQLFDAKGNIITDINSNTELSAVTATITNATLGGVTLRNVPIKHIDTAIKSKYIKATRVNNVPIPSNQLIVDVSKEAKRFLNDLFAVESELKFPDKKPGLFKQLRTKSGQKIPKTLQSILKLASGRHHAYRKDMQLVKNMLSPLGQKEVAGYIDLDDGTPWHAAKKITITAQNESLERQLNDMEQHETEVDDGNFYIGFSVWVSQRVGQLASTVNTQTNKLQRHFIYMNKWINEVNPEATTEKEINLLNKFKAAVGQGMGLKIDKQSMAKSLQQVDLLMQDVAIVKVLSIIDDMQNQIEVSREKERELIALTQGINIGKRKIGGQNYHTLDALVSWNNMLRAKEAGTTFESKTFFEVDGVTNGVALSLLTMGKVTSALGEKFGFFTKDSGFTSHAEYIEDPAHADIYKTVFNRIKLTAKQENLIKQLGKLFALDRDAIKPLIIKMAYGSSTANAIDALKFGDVKSPGIVPIFYNELQEVAKNRLLSSAEKRERITALVNSINVLLNADNKVKLPKTITEEWAMNSTTLSFDQIDTIGINFTATIGLAIKTAMDEQFADLNKSRQVVNIAGQAAWAKYNAAYEFIKEQIILDKIAKKELATKTVKGKEFPIQDLTKEDYAEIDNILKSMQPLMHTALSKLDGDLDAGMFVGKLTFLQEEENASPYTQNAHIGQGMPSSTINSKRVKRVILRGKKLGFKGPGQSTFVNAIHAMDSAISALAIKVTEALNIHDAHGLGIGDIEKGANELNKNTFELMSSYSVPTEAVDMLMRVLEGEKELIKNWPGLDLVLSNVRGDFNEEIDIEFLEETRKLALKADIAKLKYLSTIEYVDQYSYPGGAYKVTKKQQAELAAKTVSLEAELVALRSALSEVASTDNADIAPVVEEEVDAPLNFPEDTPWGKVGISVNGVSTDPVLLSYLRATPNLNAKDLAKWVYRHLKSTVNKYNMSYNLPMLELLEQIVKTVTPDVKVNYITPLSTGVVPKDIRTALGWYLLDGNNESIGIKSPDFKHSGVTTGLMIHELTHAALAKEIDQPTSVASKAAVAELELMLAAVQQHVKDNNLDGFNNKIVSVQEMVAWGMSDPEFQQLLQNVSFETQANTKESGLRAFIRNMARLLFGKKANEARENALGALIANTGILFEAAQTDPAYATKKQLKLRMETEAPRAFTPEEVYDGLAAYKNAPVLSPIHDNHLRNVLNIVVKAVYGSTSGLRPQAERQAPVSAEDVFLEALRTGQAPFASKLTAELTMTDQEAFVAEATELALRDALTSSATNRRELRKLLKLARNQITVEKLYDGDWATASVTDKEQAKRIHDIIFFVTVNNEGRSDYLSQFAAAALTYKPLMDQLALVSMPVDNANYRDVTLLGAVNMFFTRLMDKFVAFSTNTYQGQGAQQKLMQLAVNLATIEAKEKFRIQRRRAKAVPLLDQASTRLAEGVKKGIEAAGESKVLKNSKLKIVQATGALISTVAGDRTELLMDNFNKLLDQNSRQRLGAMREIINEIRNGREAMDVFNDLLVISSGHDQKRKRLKEDMVRLIKNTFGFELNKKQSVAITKAAIYTDLSSLLDNNNYTLTEIEQLLSNAVTLNTTIATLEAKLTGNNAAYYSASSKGLGYFMASGSVKVDNLMMNAHNIAFLANTDSAISNSNNAVANAAIPVIDQLATLYALKYTSGEHKLLVSELIRDQSLRDSDNGIDLLLKLHNLMKKQSKEKLFENNAALMIKGYTKEIHNPYIEVLAANDKQSENLLAAGYTDVGAQILGEDPSDPNKSANSSKRLYKIRNQGLSPTVRGILPTVGRTAKGTFVHGDIINNVTDFVSLGNTASNNKIANARKNKIRNMFKLSSAFDPSLIEGPSLMVPLINEAGAAVNYRYLMNEATKDSVLERDNRIDQVMGAMAASIFDKANSVDLSINAIDAIKAQFDADYLTNPNAYIDLSASNTDSVVREQYRLLPDETKRYIRKVFGRNGMYVKNDMYNITMGFRKYSLAEPFNKSLEERNFIEGALVAAIENLPVGRDKETGKIKYLGKKAALNIARADNVWQEIVRVIKDNRVVKSLFVLLGNESSNTTVLWLKGIPLSYILKEKAKGFRATTDYTDNRIKHDQLVLKVNSGYFIGAAKIEAEREIIELKEEMLSSPIHPLVEANMYQTLVEDIDNEPDTDVYSYKSRLTAWTDEKTSWVKPGIKTAANNIFIGHGSSAYKLLNRATVMSDFTSRYVMYKYLTEESSTPMSSEAALRDARKAFVNYDTPTHKALQYLNDTGLLWFTKYYLRIQIVILLLIRDNPLRALALSGIDFFTDISDILDSGALQNSPIKGGLGALEVIDSVGSIATVNAAL